MLLFTHRSGSTEITEVKIINKYGGQKPRFSPFFSDFFLDFLTNLKLFFTILVSGCVKKYSRYL